MINKRLHYIEDSVNEMFNLRVGVYSSRIGIAGINNKEIIRHYLNIVCDSVWSLIGNGKKYSISQGEETITDNILLYLASRNIPGLVYAKTPKDKEKNKGTDWEWWIGDNKLGYLRYAIQAKKIQIDSPSNRYDTLKHKVGNAFQHDILDSYARANQAIPLYAFYNYLDQKNHPTQREWHCPHPFELTKFGCTITPLDNVTKILSSTIRGMRTFKNIHSFRNTVPLRCIVSHTYNALRIGNKTETTCLGVKAKIYRNLQGEFNILKNDGFCSIQNELYNSELKLYPSNVLITDIGDGYFGDSQALMES